MFSKTNPFLGYSDIIKEGEAIFSKHCEVCHGVGGIGYVCPDLTDSRWTYGSSDSDLFLSIFKGRSDRMPQMGRLSWSDKDMEGDNVYQKHQERANMKLFHGESIPNMAPLNPREGTFKGRVRGK